jgi:hypothetical protein
MKKKETKKKTKKWSATVLSVFEALNYAIFKIVNINILLPHPYNFIGQIYIDLIVSLVEF